MKKMNPKVKEALGTIFYFVCVISVTLLFIKYVAQRTVVDGQSMEPTLQNEDNLVVDKISYRFSDPQRFDVIVFSPYENAKKICFIKRIIGLPGETVQIDIEGNIYINGEVLAEGYGKEVIQPYALGRAIDEIVLGEDEYFVMGDNRNDSTDSRSDLVGNVKKSQFVGRAWLRIWPFSKFGFVKHQ